MCKENLSYTNQSKKNAKKKQNETKTYTNVACTYTQVYVRMEKGT